MNSIATLLRRTLAGAALFGLAAGAAPSAHAAFITVNAFGASSDTDNDANGGCTLREAVRSANTDTAIDGCAAGDGDDTIIFSPTAINPQITLRGQQIIIQDDLSIEGQNGASSRVTISGAGLSRIFLVAADMSFDLSNAILTNGRAALGGAIFYDDASSTSVTSSSALTNVTFLSNQATTSGGAVYNESILAVSGCTFTSNAALGETPADGGGAIFNAGTLMVDGGASFSGNTATAGLGNGGAIFNRSGRSVTVNTSGGAVSFSGNQAARAGGAIESGGPLTLVGVTFTGNQANINGGALHMSGGATTTSTGGTVNGNVALKEGGGYWNSAGGTLDVNGTNFANNTASGADADQGGGAIFSDGGATTVTGGTFSGNRADGASGSGGAIQTIRNADLTVTGATLTGNVSNRAGGGIEVAGGTATLTDVTFTGNVTNRAPGNGGGLHTGGATQVSVDACTFTGNQATEGGGMWISGASTAFVTNGTSFTNNGARGDASSQGGGGFYSDGGDAFLTDAEFDGNTATGLEGSGGGINAQGGSLVVEGGFVNNNITNRAGGGIEVSGGTIAVIEDVDIIGNNAGRRDNNDVTAASPGNGGGVHAGGTSNVTVILSTVTGNRAVEGGGLWNGGFSEMNVRETTIAANVSARGGGLYQAGGLNGTGKLTVRRSLIAINRADMLGGGLGARKADVEIYNTSISGNLARNGGGIGSIAANLSMLNVTLANNSASQSGGGAWNSDSEDGDAFVTLSNTIVADNAAPMANDLFGAYASGGFNLIESGATTAFTEDGTSILGQDPMLGPPADNGGPTFTHALMPGSPAINAGRTSLAVDQRGYVRPIEQDDIGAFEFGAVPPGVLVSSETLAAEGFDLSPASPNPVGSRSALYLAVSQQQAVRAVLYDALGRQVATLFDGTVLPTAQTRIEVDAARLSSGVYIVRVIGQSFSGSQQITVVR